MTSTTRRLRLSLTFAGALITAGVCAPAGFAQTGMACPDLTKCVALTLKANVNYSNLHPGVTGVQLVCTSPATPTGILYGMSPEIPVVNRGYSGVATAVMLFTKDSLADPAKRTVTVSCVMQIVKHGALGPGKGGADPQPTADAPAAITESNWAVVAPGAVVKWSQTVTFPNASAAP